MDPSSDQDFEVLYDADIEDYNDAGILPQSSEVLKQIKDWLQPTAYDDDTSEYIRHLNSHTPGTGEWLSETQEYRKWHESKQDNVLWIKAVPGTGKSVLAAHCRARVSATEKTPVLHFFFRYIVATNRTPFQLVRDWLSQLLPTSPLLQQRIKTGFLDPCQPLEAVGLSVLWQLFCDAANAASRIYCFADALDEMSTGHEGFVHELISLGKTTPCKVFLTSRPIPRIVERLRREQVLQLTLGSGDMMEDISLYVDRRIERDITHYIDKALRTSGVRSVASEDHAAIASLVRDTLRNRSQGSFLYAKLTMDDFLEKLHENGTAMTLDVARRTVEALPTGLMDVYSDMLNKHSQKSGISQTFQFDILQWVTHSERPLRLLELATILDLQQDALNQNRNTKALLRHACGPLLEIMPSDVVGPVHHSFTEYLTNVTERCCTESHFPVISFQSAHQYLATQCLLYIEYVTCKSDMEAQTSDQLKVTYPFFDYALLNWAQHVAKCGDPRPSGLMDMLDRCVTDNLLSQKMWFEQVFFKRSRSSPIYECDMGALFNHNRNCALHLAAATNLVEYVIHLAELGHDIDAKDFQGNTPIHCAAQAGALDGLNVLLALGATKNEVNNGGDSAVHLAAINNHPDIIDALARSGADLWIENPSQDYLGRHSRFLNVRPFDCAINGGHLEVAQSILRQSTPSYLTDAYGTAIRRENAKLATMVVQQPGFLVNQPIAWNKLPLHEAARVRYVDCMAALLENGASADALSPLGETALHAFASCYRNIECAERIRGVEMLLQAGCPVDASDCLGRTALCWAKADAVLAHLLMSRGADPQVVIKSGSHPLHDMYGRNLESMKIWIAHGLDINSRDLTGCTPLLSLLQYAKQKLRSIYYNPRGEETINVTHSVKNLLKLGADPNLSLESGVTPLHLASSLNHDETAGTVDSLICAGADVNARDHEGITPLMNVEPCYLSKVLPSFLNAGANIKAVDRHGRTAVFGQGHYGSLTSLSILQMSDAKFDVDARDSNGTSLLHLACGGAIGRGITLRDLLHVGACPFAVDRWGNTAIHFAAMACSAGQGNWIEQLVDLGVDPRQENHKGQSPLHLAVAATNSSTLQALLPFCQSDLDKADVQGFVPLQFAAAYSLTHVLQLLRAGANPAYRSRLGETALHFAAVARDTNIMSALLSYLKMPSLDFINSEDRSHRSALHHAARSGVPENVKILLEHGADPCFNDRNSFSSLKACSEFPQESRLWPDPNVTIWSSQSPATYLHELPGLLREEWPSLARGYGRDVRHSSGKQTFSIRMCARHLIDAANPLSGGSKLLTALKDDAIVARCEPLADELIVLIEKLEAQGSLAEIDEKLSLARKSKLQPGVRLVPPETRSLDRIFGEAVIKSLQKELRRKVEELQNKNCQQLVDLLIEYDFDPLLHHLNVANEESSSTKWSLLTTLARKGRHNALKHLALRSGKLRASPRERHSESRIERFYDATHDFLTQTFSTILKEPLDGLLMDACRSGPRNMEVVKVIVESIGCSDLEKTLAIMQIVRSNVFYWQIDAIKYLVCHGADVNAFNTSHESVLFLSCINEFSGALRPDLIKCLLELGADPNKLNSDGKSCLNVVCEPPPQPHYKIRYKLQFDAAIVDLLLDFGANPEHGNPRLIMTAIATQNISLIRRLVEARCDLNYAPEGAIGGGMNSNSENLAKMLNCLSFAAMQPVPLEDLRLNGVNVNGSERSERKHDEVIQLLLDAGANPFAPIGDGELSLHFMLSRGWRVGPILDIPGLDLEKRDQQGKTLLLSAASSRQVDESLLKMLQLGCNVEAVDSEGKNFFHHLMSRNAFPCWNLSAERDILVQVCKHPRFNRLINAPDLKGRLPIHHLIPRWSFATGVLLGEYGARLDVPDFEGTIPLHGFLSFWADPMHGLVFENIRQSLNYKTFSSDEYTNVTRTRDGAELAESDKEMAFPEWLISRGVNINVLNNVGEPALFDVLRVCPIVSQLVVGSAKEPQEQMYVEKLQQILSAGVDVYVKGRDGSTALHVLATRSPGRDGAIRTHDPLEMPVREAWKMLVAAGLDPWAEDNNQRSALDIAAASDNTTILGLY